MPQKLILEIRLPLRPGYGAQRKEVTSWANFEIVIHKDLILFRYCIKIIPVNTGFRRLLTGKERRGLSSFLLKNTSLNTRTVLR